MSPEYTALMDQLRALARTDADAAKALHKLDEHVDPFMIGLYDAQLSGWYNHESGELYSGFPVAPDDVVVDVGCGDGGALSYCASRGAHIILADIDPRQIARAEALCAGKGARALDAYVTDADPLPLADGAASRVICTEVLEHVEDPAALMAELVRVAAPGARYLLSVPDVTNERLQQTIAAPSYFERPNHVRIFERDAFRALVEDAGLVVERRAYVGFFWALWFLMFWECDVPLSKDMHHPVLDNWARTWLAVLSLERGLKIKRLLDSVLPRTQVIVARKPA